MTSASSPNWSRRSTRPTPRWVTSLRSWASTTSRARRSRSAGCWRGNVELDDVVQEPSAVVESDDLAGLFARLTQLPASPPPSPTPVDVAGSVLYEDDAEFLDDALHAIFPVPGASPSAGGVEWRLQRPYGVASLAPPRDLVQRLDVLPQSYLADRKVTVSTVLATTAAQGKARLLAALSDESPSSWPDAHYLGPLHPVLDWASDRALAALNRNEVFAVRSDVDEPTVLLIGTLTDRRGRTVAASWLTVAFSDPDSTDFAPVDVHSSAGAALTALGWDSKRPNTGAVSRIDELQRLIAPAVRHGESQMRLVTTAARDDVSQRVEEWATRLRDWDDEADALIQRSDVRSRRRDIAEERGMTASMNPDRQLVRPLLVVVPMAWGEAQ